MKKLLILLTFVISSFALGPMIADDEFVITNGDYKYTSDGSDVKMKDGNLYLDRSKYAETTYSIGENYANHKVDVKIRVILPKNVSNKIAIFKNGSKKTTLYASQEYTLSTSLDENGNIRIGFKQYNSNSYAYVDYVRIYDKTLENQDNPREFKLYRSDNIKGDIKIIGNSVLEADDGKCVDNNTRNNNINAVFADKDNDPTTKNSTSAKLTLPLGVTSDKILYALLYWQGRFDSNEKAIANGKDVKIKLAGTPNYQLIHTDETKFNYIKGAYQGVADITDIFKRSVDLTLLTNSVYNQDVWVADVQTDTGENAYGAWSLVVVYKDNNAHLKNITFYDGYDKLYDNSKSYTIDGFVTPTKGDVVSKFSIFAGEGDIGNKDGVSLTDKSGVAHLISDDFFKSSEDIDGENIDDRNPNCTNTIGIDIRTISVGSNSDNPIIENGQDSTTLTLSSVDDAYFPGFFSLATDLYEPRVCYYIDTIKDLNGHTIYENRHFVDDVVEGQEYQINLWIANMKKDENDDDLEDAKNVHIFLDTNEFSYSNETTFIKNIGDSDFSKKTDAKDNDIFEFYSPSTFNYRLGEGADSVNGGTIFVTTQFDKDENKSFIQMNGKFVTGGNNLNLDDVFHFKATFNTNTLMNKFEPLPMEKCVDFESEGNVVPPLNGHFNVVSDKFNSTKDPVDINDERNYLYTQSASKPFNVQVLHLADDYETLTPYMGPAIVELVEAPSYNEYDSDEEKALKCQNAVSLSQSFVMFKNTSKETLIVNYPNINKNVTFRIKSLKTPTQCQNECAYSASGIVSSSDGTESFARCQSCLSSLSSQDMNVICSRDTFAIRPDHFEFTITNSARADNNISTAVIKAVDYNNNVVNYNEVGTNLQIKVKDKKGCLEATPKYSLEFKNGIANIDYLKYPEVGEVEFNISEKDGYEFAKIDADDTSDAQRFINSGITNYIPIYPDHFDIVNIAVNNFNNGDFTYLSKDLYMSGVLSATIKAKNKTGDITLNYSDACYAKNVDVNISHSADASLEGLNKIITQYGENNKDENISFVLDKSNFNTGESSLEVKINFDRNSSIKVAPFRLTLDNIYLKDEDDTNASNTIGSDISYLYGKATPNDVSTIENETNVSVEFEYFNGSSWIINDLHTNKIYGDVNNTYTTSNVDINLNEDSVNKEQNITVSPNTITRPYKVKLHMFIPSWLWYGNDEYQDPSNNNLDCNTHPCSNVLFLGTTNKGWAGFGTNEKENSPNLNTIQTQIKQKTKKDNGFRRLNW